MPFTSNKGNELDEDESYTVTWAGYLLALAGLAVAGAMTRSRKGRPQA
jgi:hypothetical protein